MYLKDKMTWLAIILFIGFVFLMENVLASHATPAICQAESNMAFFMADSRDDGITKEQSLVLLKNIKMPNVQREAAVANIEIIYDNSGLEPWIVGRIAYESCFSH